MKISVEERRKRVEALVKTSRSTIVGNREFTPEYLAYFKRASITEEQIDSPAGKTKIYLVRPDNLPEKNFPVFIYIHGGGFAKGHGERDLYFGSRIAEGIQGMVVDIDYHTTAEVMFPIPFEECYTVAKWVFEHAGDWGADLNRISMGGCSAGANLTAAVALKANETKEFKLAAQVLHYGAFDFAADQASKPNAATNRISPERSAEFCTLYTEDDPELLKSPYVSPLLAPDAMLYGLPDTLITTAEKCMFNVEGEEYGKRLAGCGVPVTIRRFLDSDHGFIIACTDEWQEAHNLMIRYLLQV